MWPQCPAVKTHAERERVRAQTTGGEQMVLEIIRKELQLLVFTAVLQSESHSKVVEMLAEDTEAEEANSHTKWS